MAKKYRNLRADPNRRRKSAALIPGFGPSRAGYADRHGVDPVEDLGFAEAEYQGYSEPRRTPEVDPFPGSHESGFEALPTPEEIEQDALIDQWLADQQRPTAA